MGRVTRRAPMHRLTVRARAQVDGVTSAEPEVQVVRRPDTLAVEEPLELRVDGRSVVVTMRTPGDDLDLAFGFLLTEGLLTSPHDVATAVHCTDVDDAGRRTFNVLDVTLAPGVPPLELEGRRSFGMTSACGVCGSASIEEVRRRAGTDLSAVGGQVRAVVLAGMPATMLAAQGTFARTGGLHAAALFQPDGRLLAVREDVGRHNAVDKVLGWAAREGRWPLGGHVLLVSGRASYELAQKAWMGGVPVLAAVSAPSSLAVDVAERAGMTLVGFVRPPTLNVYTRADRVVR
ncbi:MAG: formate dehydrogenase accessory sulfurtransferase FdhD [Actinomycetes bacterium]